MEARALKVTSYPTSLKVKGREGAAPERAHWKIRLAPYPWSLLLLIPSRVMSLVGIRDVVNLLSMPAK